MIIYYDHQCGKLIYRVNLNGQPHEFLTFDDAIRAKFESLAEAL